MDNTLTFEGIVMLNVLMVWRDLSPAPSRNSVGAYAEEIIKTWNVPLYYSDDNFNNYLTYQMTDRLLFLGLIVEHERGLRISDSGMLFLTELTGRHGLSWVKWPIEIPFVNLLPDWANAKYVEL